jgi:hypothetical protein
MPQLYFDFIPVMDQELAERRRQEAIESKRRIQDSWLHSAVEDLPPRPEEWDVILMGIRLSRHVHHSECERCKLASRNHCPRGLGSFWEEAYSCRCPIKVCLKDYIRWCVQHGHKDWAKEILEPGYL